MQVTTIAEARALVGRTFERDGERRTVVEHGYSDVLFWLCEEACHVMVSRQCADRWLSKATEVPATSSNE